MEGYDEALLRLLSLLAEALETSRELLDYTRQKYDVLYSGNNGQLTEALGEREKFISALTNLECRTDLVLEELGMRLGDLPQEAERLRQAIRSTLGAVTEMDVKLISAMSAHLQEYKDLTIKARNKKHISAYLKAGMLKSQGNRFDIKK